MCPSRSRLVAHWHWQDCKMPVVLLGCYRACGQHVDSDCGPVCGPSAGNRHWQRVLPNKCCCCCCCCCSLVCAQTMCGAGRYSTGGVDPCTPCPLGSYAAVAGSASCTYCPVGQYGAVAGQGSASAGCALCSTGPGGTHCSSCDRLTSICTGCDSMAYTLVSGACILSSTTATASLSTTPSTCHEVDWVATG